MTARAKLEPNSVASELDRLDLYRVFAFAFGLPTPERYDWLCRPDLAVALECLWQSLGVPGEFPAPGRFDDYEDYESTYIALFDVGVPEPPAPLLESAHNKAVPPQQTALENVDFYEVLGLKHNPSQFASDHLVTQLEFLAALSFARENSTDAANKSNLDRLERDFLERHLLNWLPVELEKLTRQKPPFFPVLLALPLAFVRQRYSQLSAA